MDMMFMFKAKYDGRAETIISSVIRMAKWLNIPVIAEGVDKAEQVEFLKSVGCDYIQGFYYSKPCLRQTMKSLFQIRRNSLCLRTGRQ